MVIDPENNISISFVIPCLNEEKTLGFVLTKIVKICKEDLKGYKTEIIVSDNGSEDRSIEIARSFGVRVVNCPIKGYGAAIKYGVANANNRVIIFADADDTYDFNEAPLLINEIEKGFDLVIGSRLKGKVVDGAMPWLHRYLGTPALNGLINRIFSSHGYHISDCNSGFRCFIKESFEKWNIQSNGMEFASEMLVKALKNNAKISEVPVTLYPDHVGRTPHLKTWRDGMRHLLRILVEAPSFFNSIGLSILLISYIILFICLFTSGYINILGMSLFGIHTMIFALLASLLGQTIWSIGLFISVKENSNQNIYTKMINLSEDFLFWLLLALCVFSFICFGSIIGIWAAHGFKNLALQKSTLFLAAITASGMIFMTNLFSAHLLKRL